MPECTFPLRTPSIDNYRKVSTGASASSRELGRLSLHAAWSDGAPGNDYYNGHAHSRSALVVGASWVL